MTKIFCGALLALLSSLAPAHAVAMLDLISATSDLVIVDNGPLDLNSALGVVSYNGPVGVFTSTFTTGITLPALGSAAQPQLSLTSTGSTAESGGFLTILFGEEDAFGPLSGALLTQITGSNSVDLSLYGGGITYTTNTTNAQLSTQGPFTSTFYHDTFTGSAVLPAQSPLFQQVILNLAPNTTSQFNATLSITPVGSSVPEGSSTIVLLGLAATILVIARKLTPDITYARAR